MGKAQNRHGTTQVTLSLSEESVNVLTELAILGIYGKNEAEVASRFVDKALEGFVVPPRFELPLRKGNKRSSPKGNSSGSGNAVVKSSSQKRKRVSSR